MQIELHDLRASNGQLVLEVVDHAVAPAPHRLRHEVVDAHDEHVLVVGTVEDADHAAGWDLSMDTPEKVVAGFEGGGHLEGGDLATLRIDAGEDVADGAVFAGAIHALKDDEQGLGLIGVEDVLEVGELFAMRGEESLGGVF